MEQLNVREIERRIRDSVNYYFKDMLAATTAGFIRTGFDAALAKYGLDSVTELPQRLAGCMLDTRASDTGNTSLTQDNGKTRIVRLVSIKHKHDVDQLELQPELFTQALTEAIDQYVGEMRGVNRYTTHASVPLLYVKIEAYQCEWFIWGWIGEANDQR